MIGKLLWWTFKILKDEGNRKELAEMTKGLADVATDPKKRKTIVKDLKEAVKDIPKNLQEAAAEMEANANRDIPQEMILREKVEKEFDAFRKGRNAADTWGKVSKWPGNIPNGVLYDWAVYAEKSGQLNIALEIYERLLTARRVCGDTVERYEALKKRMKR